MKIQSILFFSLLLFQISSFAQNKEAQEILEEGQLMYRLEKASWYATDDLIIRFSEKLDSVGGYLSYETEDHFVITIFFKHSDPYSLLVKYQFDSLPQPKFLKIDTNQNKANDFERELITVRQDAINRIYENTEGFFKYYENTSYNLIPLINKKERKVVVLTGPKVEGILLIGNDYVLKYNDENQFISKEKMHNSLLQFQTRSDDPENSLESTYHSHVLHDLINSTDICTLLLYKEYTEWKQHTVISKKYVCIFNTDKEELIVLSKKAWKRMNKRLEKE